MWLLVFLRLRIFDAVAVALARLLVFLLFSLRSCVALEGLAWLFAAVAASSAMAQRLRLMSPRSCAAFN